MQNCALNARGVGAKKPKSDLGIRKNISNAFWRKEVTWMERNGAGRAVLWPAHPHGLSSLCQMVQKARSSLQAKGGRLARPGDSPVGGGEVCEALVWPS